MSYFDNHFLFSETYIKEQNNKKSQTADEIEDLFKEIKQWHDEYVSGDNSDEPWSNYIDSVLDALNFQKKQQNSYRLLYADTIKEGGNPVAICNLIDKNEHVSSTTKGEYYAFNTVSEAKTYGANWAILTNGCKWRIYNTNNVSPYENFLEIDLEGCIRNNTKADEAFKLFYLFFYVHAYYTKNGQLNIENIKDLSDKKAEIIEETLRGKSEEILKELCYGLKEDMPKETYTVDEKKAIYNDAIILLYRLFFFGYAESRGLLPVVENDPEYTDSYKKLCDDAVKIYNASELYKIKDRFDFWDRLDNQLRIYVDSSYNGGLFNNEKKPILKKHRISNGRLIKCLAEISYNLDKSNKYSEIIEYKDLTVRNLGAIYEGLLEYRLFIAEERMVQRKNNGQIKFLKETDVKLQNSDSKYIIEKGGIYLSQDALERKETGAYYTPEDVVEYIVGNTVGKKLEELKKELFETKKILLEELSYEPVISNKRVLQRRIDEITLDFINEKILSLSIIDSAMGSGHFLVNAAYRIANEIVSMIAENNWKSDEEYNNADIKYWKRKVVEDCIYGIDINELSVSLARLSLWLISASNDKALSFIDHHLKVGNSIIGTNRNYVELKNSQYPMFGVAYEDYMKPVISKYEKLKNIGSATKDDVAKQKEIYDEINNDLKIAKKKYDYYLANQYLGGISNEDTYGNLLRSNNIDDFKHDEMEGMWKLAKNKSFFHWELEFPEIFQKGGFDIMIGNPPYVEADSKDFIQITNTKKCHNLYAYMIETNINNMKQKSYFGFILPTASISTPRMASLQKLLINSSKNIYISTFDDRPAKIFQRLESIRVAIIYGELSTKNKINEVYTTKYNRWYAEDRKYLFDNLNYVKLSKYDYLDGYIPKVGSHFENSIYHKLFSVNKKIGDYIEDNTFNNGLHYGYGVRYWIKGMDNSAEEIDKVKRKSTGDKKIDFSKNFSNKIFTALINSSLFFLYFTSFSDARNLTKNTILSFPFKYEKLTEDQEKSLINITNNLMENYLDNSKLKNCSYISTGNITYREYYPKKSKNIIDRIDDILAEYYGFNKNELEYIKNYELQFRMGKDWKDGSDDL